jgi:hypothetical protein
LKLQPKDLSITKEEANDLINALDDRIRANARQFAEGKILIAAFLKFANTAAARREELLAYSKPTTNVSIGSLSPASSSGPPAFDEQDRRYCAQYCFTRINQNTAAFDGNREARVIKRGDKSYEFIFHDGPRSVNRTSDNIFGAFMHFKALLDSGKIPRT